MSAARSRVWAVSVGGKDSEIVAIALCLCSSSRPQGRADGCLKRDRLRDSSANETRREYTSRPSEHPRGVCYPVEVPDRLESVSRG